MGAALLALWVATAALPDGELTLLLEVAGQPAGTVTLSRAGEDYRYVSRHLFAVAERPAERVREGRYVVDARGRTASGAIPAGLWLWRRPAPGCVQGLEELDDVEGPQCAQAGARGEVVGTLRGVAFTARYAPDGRLSELELPGARLRRVASGKDVRASVALLEILAAGIPLPAGPGALAWRGGDLAREQGAVREGAKGRVDVALTEWNERAARALSHEVDASFPDKRQGAADLDPTRLEDVRGGCLAHARRFVARAATLGQVAVVVHGLVAHEGALRPHAWVRVGLPAGRTLELDPALGLPVGPTTHLLLGVESKGVASPRLGGPWWEVISGRRGVTRACGPKPLRQPGDAALAEELSSRAICAPR